MIREKTRNKQNYKLSKLINMISADNAMIYPTTNDTQNKTVELQISNGRL